jgi:ornithine cyclodeaminase
MQTVDADTAARLLDYPALIGALGDAFKVGVTAPERAVYALPAAGSTLMTMPAWNAAATGVKVLTIMPGNPVLGLPLIQASYLLFDGPTGSPLVVIDGTELTRRRTAAMAALAAKYLARPQSSVLLMIGTGALAPHCVRAHAAVLGLRRVLLYGRSQEKVADLARELAELPVEIAGDLEQAVAASDVIVSATSASVPFLRGDWLTPGKHVALIGSYQHSMAEADDTALTRSRVYADTREGVLAESGEVAGAIARGVFKPGDIVGDLSDLVSGRVAGRTDPQQITLFKSVGTAVADLAGAMLVQARLRVGAA